jgi:hypothetical protein
MKSLPLFGNIICLNGGIVGLGRMYVWKVNIVDFG